MAVREYIGARYVPLFADPIEWDNTKQTTYEPLTIVLHEGNSYTSKQYVPLGIDILNEKYWAITGNYNAQIEQYRKEVKEVKESIINRVRFYDSVASMIADNNLKLGDMCITESFFKGKKKGGCAYIITTGIPNGYDSFQVGDNIAAMIKQPISSPEMFGAYGDGLNDDSDPLQYCFNTSSKIICDGLYKITKTIDINNNIDMVKNSRIICGAPLTYGVIISNNEEESIQTPDKYYNIIVDARGLADTAVVCAGPKNSRMKIKVYNSGRVGIESNKDKKNHGNNQNILWFDIEGNSDGSTEIGAILNGYDSIYEMIVTKDCKIGVDINANSTYINHLHSWIREEMRPILWANSKVINNRSVYYFNVDYLYQDGVKYGIYGNGNGNINYFQYNDSASETNSDYEQIHVTSSNRYKVNTFINAIDESEYMRITCETPSVPRSGGCIKNGIISSTNNAKALPFSSIDDVLENFTFYCKYDTPGLPSAINSMLICTAIDGCATQTVIQTNGKAVFMRVKQNASPWSSWIELYKAK